MTPTQPTPTWPRYFKPYWAKIVIRFDNYENFGTYLHNGKQTDFYTFKIVTGEDQYNWTEITATEAAEMVAKRSKQ